MRKREFQKSKEELIADCQRAIKDNTTDKRFLRRVLAVNMFLNGSTQKEVCTAHCVARQTFSEWLTVVEKQGIGALRDKKHPGREPRLTKEQLDEIKETISKDAEGEAVNIWDGPRLSEFIKEKYGVTLKVRRCQYLLHEMGFSLIRPQTFPNKGEKKRRGEGDI